MYRVRLDCGTKFIYLTLSYDYHKYTKKNSIILNIEYVLSSIAVDSNTIEIVLHVIFYFKRLTLSK